MIKIYAFYCMDVFVIYINQIYPISLVMNTIYLFNINMLTATTYFLAVILFNFQGIQNL